MAASAFAAETQPPVAPSSPKFDIREFKVEGNTLLPEADVAALMAPYTGQSRDFGDVQQALEALQNAYRNKGYSSVHVLLPEQELEQGIVRLRVLEQHIGSITIKGNEYHDNANIMRTLPSIAEGGLPSMREVRRALKVANENPSKQTAILFKNVEDNDNLIDANIKVIDDKPWRAFLTVDNTGDKQTINGRIGFGFQHYNLFGKDHRVTVQYITNTHFPESYFNPEHKVNILGAAYTIPFYEWGDSLDMIGGYSDVNSGTIANAGINVTGKGLILGAHYNHNFDKTGNYDHKLTGAFDYHAYREDVLSGGSATGLTPHVTATPLSLTYAGLWGKEQQQFSFNVGGSWNFIPNTLAAHGGADIYAGSPYLAENNYQKYRINLDYLRPFAKILELHVAVNAQLTSDHLIPGEQFFVGGMDSVRGWHESVISGDKGIRYSVEVISPDFGNKISEKVGLRALVFTDGAHVSNDDGVDGSPAAIGSTKSIASVGAGLRYNYGKDIVARLDYAYVVDGDITKDNPGGSRKGGDTFGHVSVGWIW